MSIRPRDIRAGKPPRRADGARARDARAAADAADGCAGLTLPLDPPVMIFLELHIDVRCIFYVTDEHGTRKKVSVASGDCAMTDAHGMSGAA